jgi:hypothetical protein
MGKITTDATMSIDGYIAGPGESGFEGTGVTHIAYAVRKDRP